MFACVSSTRYLATKFKSSVSVPDPQVQIAFSLGGYNCYHGDVLCTQTHFLFLYKSEPGYDMIACNSSICAEWKALGLFNLLLVLLLVTMVIASLMMMSPMIVWRRKREEEYPHQYMVHNCTPRDSTTITDSRGNGGEEEGHEKLQIYILMLIKRPTSGGQTCNKEAADYFLACILHTATPNTHLLTSRSEAMTHENHL